LAGLSRRARTLPGRVTNNLSGVNRGVDAGAVALTFDDGPQPGSTDRILDILARLDVRATFFCVGKNAEAHPDLIQRMHREGHAVGSHSHTHPTPRDIPILTLAKDYARGRRVIEDILGQDTSLFRPPHGDLTPASAAMVRRQRLNPWLWTVDPEDWRPGATIEHIQAVAGRATGGDVILLHDWIEQPWAAAALDRSATVAALPAIVAAVRARGLSLERLQS
jgi:peptidoglycan-N-acetylglucosamine deacetylase